MGSSAPISSSSAPARRASARCLSPQGKIIADFIVVEAPAQDGGGFFLDVPRAVAKPLLDKLNLYKLRSRLIVGDSSDTLGVLAAWDGEAAATPAFAPLLMPIRACRRSACARSCRRSVRPTPPRPSVPSSSTRASTRGTASRWAFRRAASIFNTATPFPTRPTWISLAASISPKAAMSARRWFRAWSIAAVRARAPYRFATTARYRRRPGLRSRPAGGKSARWVPLPPAVGSRCCASTGWQRRCRAAKRFSPAASRSGRSSRIGPALPFPDGTKAAE